MRLSWAIHKHPPQGSHSWDRSGMQHLTGHACGGSGIPWSGGGYYEQPPLAGYAESPRAGMLAAQSGGGGSGGGDGSPAAVPMLAMMPTPSGGLTPSYVLFFGSTSRLAGQGSCLPLTAKKPPRLLRSLQSLRHCFLVADSGPHHCCPPLLPPCRLLGSASAGASLSRLLLCQRPADCACSRLNAHPAAAG